MAAMNRVRVPWNGLGGLPGLSTFYFDVTSTTAVAAVFALFNTIKAKFPAPLSWSVPGSGDQIDGANGNLIGTWTMAGSGTVNAVNTAAYAAGCGARIKWQTATIIGGRRVIGSTFLVPLLAAEYDSGGTINDTDLASMQTAVDTFAAGGDLYVWHRPTSPGASDGVSVPVTSGIILDKVSTLRSRRT